MSVEILRTVNSAAFALRRRIAAVEEAIALLGMKPLESLVLTVAVRDALPKKNAPGFDHRRFWQAAARRASTARALAKLLHPAKQMESFTAALLQDMAVPFLAAHDPGRYGPILEQWHEDGGDLAELEHTVFEWDHAEVASWIAYEWDFPESLIVDIALHHAGFDGDTSSLPSVALVSFLRENEENLGEEELIEVACERFEIPQDDLERLLRQSFDEAAEITASFT
jgi:HD-like signal output (HDOD) protein